MRRDENNVCQIAGVTCPYALHCLDCDIHNSVERARRLAAKMEDNDATIVAIKKL